MQDSARKRLATMAGHFGSAASSLDIAEVQRLLEHDNFENRQKLKELMRDPLFVP